MVLKYDEYTETELPARLIIDTVLSATRKCVLCSIFFTYLYKRENSYINM